MGFISDLLAAPMGYGEPRAKDVVLGFATPIAGMIDGALGGLVGWFIGVALGRAEDRKRTAGPRKPGE